MVCRNMGIGAENAIFYSGDPKNRFILTLKKTVILYPNGITVVSEL